MTAPSAATLLPMHLRTILARVHEEIRAIEERVADLEGELRALADADPPIVFTLWLDDMRRPVRIEIRDGDERVTAELIAS